MPALRTQSAFSSGASSVIGSFAWLCAVRAVALRIEARHYPEIRYAINVPNFGDYADPAVFVDLAQVAEHAGWDGLFVWDHILLWDRNRVADPWVLLAAAAASTKRIRLGPMVTPIPRRRPWKLARETTSLDLLSEGRLVFGVGIGFPTDVEFGSFGEVADEATRGEMLDEGLEILTGMWSGDRFGYEGKHYQVEPFTFGPPPAQKPRIPVWVAGMWPNRVPFRRAAAWDGVFPIKIEGDQQVHIAPEDVIAIRDYISLHRGSTDPFDITVLLPGLVDHHSRGSGVIERFADAGVTWLQDGPDPSGESVESFLDYVREGPPD